MDVRKTIAELTSQLSEVNYDSEEDDNLLLKESQLHEDQNTEENFISNDIEPSKLRRNTDTLSLPKGVYSGKTTSRKKAFSGPKNDSENEEMSMDENDGDLSDPGISDDNEEVDDNETTDDESANESISSEDETKSDSTSKLKPTGELEFNPDIYSAASKNVTSDINKGLAIKNQMRIWENLLECRIKLQKGLVASNNLPLDLVEATLSNPDKKTSLNKCKKSIILLLEKLLNLQEMLLKQSSEFKKGKSLQSGDGMDEEIKSDTSDDDNEEEEVKGEECEPKKKRRRLEDFSSSIKELHNQFIPFRNASIQKWNDKTQVSSGKMANSNFSAFDQSTLKQIEQILADKSRLINRTRIKRQENNKSDLKNHGNMEKNDQDMLDTEIFDDTDFYHKLLRDFIEKKTVDVAGSSQTERQMIELQKLRSKMKKNVDTKSTKGRKLRYVVIPKLVNFMAPHPYNSWSEQAETELYNSLFGKIKVV